MNMTWEGLIRLSLSKKRPKKSFPDTLGAGYLWLSQCTVAPTAFWKCVSFGHPVQFHVGKPYFVTRFVFSRNVRNVHAVLGHDQWKTVHDNRRGGEEGQGGGQYFLHVSPHHPRSAPVWPFFFGFTHLIQTNYWDKSPFLSFDIITIVWALCIWQTKRLFL